MVKQFNFKGLIAPVFTIYDANQKVVTDSIPKYAKFLFDSGIKGILVNGTTGEGPSLSVEERKLVTEAWAQAVKMTGQHLMVQIGGAPLPDVLNLAKHAESLGVNSILCLPELYFKPKNPSELIDYLKLVAGAASITPILYYHIPNWTTVEVHMGEFLNEIKGTIPNFVGIKFTSNNLDEGMEAVNAANGKFSVFLGADTLLAGALALGFDSAIATTLNIFPKLSVDIVKAYENNQVETAREIQAKLTKLTKIITEYGAWVPTMKAAMNISTPIHVGLAREPLKNLTIDKINEMKQILMNAN